MKNNYKNEVWRYIKKNTRYLGNCLGPNTNELERYFESIFEDKIESENLQIGRENYLKVPTDELDGEITREEIIQSAKRMKGNKAACLDMVQGNLWKELVKIDKYLEIW